MDVAKSKSKNLFNNAMTGWNNFVQNHRKAYATIFSIIAGFMFSTSFMLIKLCKSVNGADASLARVCVMVITLGSYCLYKKYPVFYFKRRISILLFLRTLSSIFGSLGAFTAVQFIPLPDHNAIQYTAVAFTAVFARIFLKESFNIVFLVAILISILGVVMVSKPSIFLGSPQIGDNISNISMIIQSRIAVNNTIPYLLAGQVRTLCNSTALSIKSDEDSTLLTTVGFMCSLLSALAQANTYIVVKKMTSGEDKLKNVEIIYNFSLYSIAPLFIACIIWRAVVKSSEILLATDLMYVVLSSIAGMSAQLAMNMALKQYDASYVSLIRGCDIIFSFIFQATIFELEGNFITYTGISLMVASLFIINLYKIWQRKRKNQIKKDTLSKNKEISNV
ncbi:hypothetical protein GJ496_009705 [Pomphorhynchus laevis]|nr:hypothetical protein GJ496_009705 [Pomphorhynchus laevis]